MNKISDNSISRNTTSYVKSNSIAHISGADNDVSILEGRLKSCLSSLSKLDIDPYKKDIIQRCCQSLLGVSSSDATDYKLQPHVIEELKRVSEAYLPRYLFYRYRYDVYPITRELDSYPPCVQIEPTSICNYRCVFCYQTDRSFNQGRHGHMGQMSLDTFRRVIDEIEGQVEAVTLASRGEPLLCSNISPMLAYLQGKFLALKINTNAWYLDERKAHDILSAEPSTLVFSADAADSDLYSKLRVNGKLERVVSNIKLFADIRSKHYPKSRIITRVSGVKYSEEQNFDEMETFWREYVDQVAFVDYNPWENVYDLESNGKTQPCSDLWRRAFVWWDGRVNPCDVDYKSSMCVGPIGEKSLSDLWLGEAYDLLRTCHVNNRRQEVSPCSSCSVV